MNKSRKIYGSIFLFSLFILLLSGSRYVLAAVAATAALLLLLRILLSVDAKGIQLMQKMQTACVAGQELEISMEALSKRRLRAAGILEVTMAYRNVLFGFTGRQQIQIPLAGRQESFLIPFGSELCGEVHVKVEKAVCYDLFGLCRAELECPGEQMLTVHPGKVPIRLLLKRQPQGYLEGEQYYQSRKGNDVSEVFDLREYYPGDDIRSIHWKLSSKMDSVIVREGGDTSHYDTILLFDAGLGGKEKQWDKKVLSSAVELGISVSGRLIELGIPHYIGIPAGDRILRLQVSDRADYLQMIDIWMGITLPKKSGIVLQNFLIEKMQKGYTKLIYVAVGEYSEELFQMEGELDMTAICLQENGDQVGLTQRGSSQLVELPYDLLYSHPHNISI